LQRRVFNPPSELHNLDGDYGRGAAKILRKSSGDDVEEGIGGRVGGKKKTRLREKHNNKLRKKKERITTEEKSTAPLIGNEEILQRSGLLVARTGGGGASLSRVKLGKGRTRQSERKGHQRPEDQKGRSGPKIAVRLPPGKGRHGLSGDVTSDPEKGTPRTFGNADIDRKISFSKIDAT